MFRSGNYNVEIQRVSTGLQSNMIVVNYLKSFEYENRYDFWLSHDLTGKNEPFLYLRFFAQTKQKLHVFLKERSQVMKNGLFFNNIKRKSSWGK